MRGATREIQAALYRLQDALRGLQRATTTPSWRRPCSRWTTRTSSRCAGRRSPRWCAGPGSGSPGRSRTSWTR
jgi:hypothetical protein